jgi:hypothetical protein
MTAPESVEVICPECQNHFLVPDGAPEAVCPQCKEHIVWRRCLDTDQVFPVLTKWTTWIHPGCDSVHVVDLTVKVQVPESEQPPQEQPPAEQPAPAAADQAAPPTPTCLIEDAQWVEQNLRGQLMIDPVAFGIAGPSAGPVAIAWTRDVLDYALSLHPSAAATEPPKKRFGRRKAEATPVPILLVVNSRAGQHTITGYADIDALRASLEERLRPVIEANTA